MNFVETTAPISIENLKKYFTDKSTFFIINYKESALKGSKLLTYLSNLDVPCDISFTGCTEQECSEMIKDYLNTTMIVNIKSLEKAIINLLLQYKNIVPKQDTTVLEENDEILEKWVSRLDSLTLYNMYSIGEGEFKNFVKAFETDDTQDLSGVNFVSLLKHQDFYIFYSKVDKEKLKFYSSYFNDYMFKGKNLYSYWANENNHMFLLTYGIASGEITGDSYINATKQTLEELSNAAPV